MKKWNVFNKIMSVVLAMVMVVSMLPMSVFATQTGDDDVGVTPATEAVVVAIDGTAYATLAEALTAAKTMTGDVTVEIYDKVTLNSNLTGSYNSITFVSKDTDAEIYLEVEGYITATGKKVAFADLILSKSAGGYITNAGFMNVAFGVYDVTEVTYTDCTFANGAYASSGKVTYTGCTFKRSYDKYGLWAYGDVDVTVDDCTFADYRGIKMYTEGAAKTVDLTVKNTDFSAVDNKPAIVLTYGESVTLEDNTYSSTGVFELDLDGAPNGTAVTSDVAPTCKNDNGACGVLVDGKIYTTVAQAAAVATSGSTVTLLHNSTENVELAEGVTLDKNGYTADSVTVKVSAPTGSITNVYTSTNDFWGEGGGNASESLAIELYEGETKIASAQLNNIGGIIDGDVFVTWHIPFVGSNDEYWTVEWAEGYPKYDMAPTKGVMVIDGVAVAEGEIKYNAPDDLNKIVALAEGKTGGVAAYTTLTEAMGQFDGRKVNVLRDVTEDISGFYGVTLTGNGVTITDTNTAWVDFDDVTVASGVTVNIPNVYSGDSENVIEGTLNVGETYYHGYDAKTTVQNGGKVTVGDSTILRYNESADAGLYIYGDDNGSTVEFDCDYYIGAYSGTFYVEDANVECGYFLLKNSYDNSDYADIDMTLDNSSVTVVGTTDTQDSFIIDDQASLTLKNGSAIADVRDFNILTGTNLTLSVDATSSISATYMNVAEDVPFEAVANGDGTFGVKAEAPAYVAEVNGVEYADLQEAIKAAAPNGTVELLSNVTVDKWLMISETLSIGSGQIITIESINGLTIDGNGHTLTVKSIESASNGGYLFYDATKLNVQDLTIKYADGLVGGIGLNSGTISNVTFDGGVYGVLPSTGKITITDCAFKTNGTAIYFENERDSLTVTENTFDLPSSESYAIILRGDATFTDNTVISGKVNVAGSATGEVSGNDFGGNRFKVYNEATATIENNTINNLVFNDETVAQSTFANNKLSAAAEEALKAVTPVVAKIGETEYTDLHEAMVAAKAGETVVLVSNVDLAGTEWEPVSFKGAFDGQGHVISNLTINKPGVSNTGFITSLNGTFKNVTFTNPTVTGGENTGVVAGRAGGGAALAEGITVNGTIKVETTHSGYARAGVIVGGWAYGNYKNITVDGGDKDVSYIKHTGGGDGRYVAGIVGHADDVDSYVNCVVKNITISGGWLCGGIAGPGPSDGVASGCAVENVDMGADYSGGMFGWYYGTGTIEDSSVKNVAFIDGTTKNGAIGGYSANDSATVTNVTIENVTNGDAALLDHVAKVNGTYYFDLQAALDAAQAGDTVTLLANVTEQVIIPESLTVTIDLAGFTLNGCIKPSMPESLTVVNGSIVNTDGEYSGIEITAGALVLENVNITSARHALRIDGAVTATIDGGEYRVNSTSGTRHAVNVSGAANVTIKDGVFVGPRGTTMDSGSAVCVQTGATVTIEGGSFSGGKNATLGVSGTLTVKGGTYDQDPSTYVDTACTVVEQSNGTFLVGMLPDADVENLGTITVVEDDGDDVFENEFDGSYYIYDLIGGTSMTTATAPFDLTIAMDFTAKDTAEQAAANAFGGYTTDFFITMDGMSGDSFVGDGCYLAGYYKSFGAWVLIPLNGFTIENGKAYPVITSAGFDFSYEAICSDVKQFICGIYLTPEVLEANPGLTVDLTLGLSENMDAALAADFVVVDSYNYDADDLTPKTYVAQIGNAKYETLAEALTDARPGDTVTLLGDVKITGKLTIDKAITIDGNNHSIIADETAVWYTVSGKLNIKSYKTHLVGINSDGIMLKNIVLDNNDNAAGINVYCAQNVVFDNVSIINATKGFAALTVNGSTLTVKNALTALGNAVAIDVSNGSGVTSTLGLTVEDDAVLNLDNKTVKFASVASMDVTGAVNAAGEPYFVARDNAYFYTEAQMESRSTAYSNGLTLLADVELNRDIEVKGTLNLNGNSLTMAEGKSIKSSSNLTVTGEGNISSDFVLTSKSATLTAPEGLTVTTTVDGYEVVYSEGVYSLEQYAIKVTYPVGNPVYPEGKVEYYNDMLEAVPYTTNCPRLEGATITLLKDTSGAGMRFMENDMVFDLNGHTYTITAGTGSQGTNTSGFQIRPEVTTNVIFKNGTIKVAEGAPVVWMFNVYATDFIVEDVTIDCTNMDWSYGESCYVSVSRSGDNVQFTGSTKVENFNSEVAGYAINVGGTMTIGEDVVPGGTIELDAGATLTAPAGLTVVTADGYKVVYNNGTYSTVEIVYVAQIDDVKYATLAEALKALQANDTLTLLDDITVSETWDCRSNGAKITVPVTIDGNGKTLKLIGSVDDKNWNCVFRFEDVATVKNLAIDASEAAGIQRGISSKLSITVEGCTLIGNGTTAKRAVIFGEGAGTAIADVTATITDSEFVNWSYGVSDNQNAQDAKSVTVTGNTFTNAGAIISAAESVTFTGNTVTGGEVNITSYTAADTVIVTATGNALTEDMNEISVKPENVTADGAFDLSVAKIGSKYYTDLAKAFTKAADGATITMVADTELSQIIANTKAVTLDLAGKTITGTDTTEKNFSLIDNRGTLTVKDSEGEGKFTLTATVNSGWNRYSAVIANNPGGKLIVESGVIEHLGGTDMAYGIDNLTNGKGTYAETVINGGTVKSTYRAIRQFLNGVEAQNILTINGGTIEGANKSIWMQDPNKNANTGELTVAEGATLNGDVYLFVTEGSTEYPVKVSIAASAVNGEVLTANFPAGYVLENKSGNWEVNEYVAKVDDKYYKTLQAAIDAVEDGQTITLLTGVTVTDPAYGQNALNHARAVSFTLDLNGQTLSADTGNAVFRFNIADSGATSDVTVTVKNGKVVSGANTWCALMASGISADVKAVMNLEDLTVEASKAGDLAIKAWGNSVINAKNVTVNATNGAGGFYALGGEIVLDDCTVNQTGLHTAPYLSVAIAVSTEGKMTVNSGTYSSEPTAAAEGNNQGSSHGSWVGGIMNSGGTLIINGGTFSNGNFGDDSLATNARGLICTDTGAVLEINGGTFNALKNVIDIQNNLSDATKNPVVTLKGGTFSSNPTNGNISNCIKVAEGYEVVENTDSTYGVVAAAPKATMTLNNLNLRLQDLLRLGFYFKVETEETLNKVGALLWTADEYAAETDFTVNSTVAYNTIATDAGVEDTYVAETEGIYAQYLDTVYYIVPYVVLESGEYVYGEANSSSALVYAALALQLNNADLKSIVIDLLNYATAARAYFCIAEELEVPEKAFNSILDASDRDVRWDDSLKAGYPEVIEMGGAYQPVFNALNTNLNEAIKLNFSFKGSVSGIGYWNAEEYAALDVHNRNNMAHEATMNYKDSYCWGAIENLYSFHIYSNFFAMAYDEDGNCSRTYGASVASYLSTVIDTYSASTADKDQAMVALAKAMLVYGDNAMNNPEVNKGTN